MAKTNGKLKMLGLMVTLAVLFAGIVTTWAVYGEDITHNTENITTNTEAIKVINDPKDGPIVDIALMKKDIEVIITKQSEMKAEQSDMRTEQRQGFKEILERLPK